MGDQDAGKQVEREKVPLSRAAQYLLEECRMVLPGIQALFGFQLIAVFNEGFSQKLTVGEQRLHLVAIVLLALAIVLIMASAAYHRQPALGRSRAHSFASRAVCCWRAWRRWQWVFALIFTWSDA